MLAYPGLAELEQYLNSLINATHYIVRGDGRVLAWACVFTRDEARWFAIIVGRSLQGKGMGTQIMQQLIGAEPVLNGWVTDKGEYDRSDGSPYCLPLPFYLKLGFKIRAEHRLELPFMSCVRVEYRR